MNIYQINAEILDCIDLDTGEIIDEERLHQLEMQKEKKIENVCLWVKNITADIEAFKAEEGSLAKRRKSKERLRDSLMNYLDYAVDLDGFETTRVKAKFNKGEKVVILDKDLIPEHYWKTKEPELSKSEIKRDIKAGIKVEGADIKNTYTLRIV